MFQFDENVIEALHLFKKQNVDYVQLVNFHIVSLDFIKKKQTEFDNKMQIKFAYL